MPLFTNVTIGDHHLSCLCSHQGVGKFRAALHALLIPPRPPKPTPTPAGPTSPTPPDDEPQFLGADDLGSLALAMMNNLSISSPLADLQDVGPSWSNPAEAPFYNPKPQKPPTAGQVDHPPRDGRVDALKPVRQALHGAPGVVQDPLLLALQQPSRPLGAPITGVSPLTMSPFSAAASQAQAQTTTYHPAAAVPTAPCAWDAFASMSPPLLARTSAEDAATATFDFTPFFAQFEVPAGPQIGRAHV